MARYENPNEEGKNKSTVALESDVGGASSDGNEDYTDLVEVAKSYKPPIQSDLGTTATSPIVEAPNSI